MKTPEQMALDYANPKFEGCNPDDDEAEVQRNHCIIDFLAGYKAASDKHFEQIRHLESELQQAKNLVMRLEAER